MRDELKLTKEELTSFCETGVLTRNDVRVMRFLSELVPEERGQLSEDEVTALVLYFAFLRDGSTCLVCDESLSGLWQRKWDGLKAALKKEEDETSNARLDVEETVAKRIGAFLAKLPLGKEALPHFTGNFPIVFEATTRMLFARKYLSARDMIRKAVNLHFPEGRKREVSVLDRTAIQKKYGSEKFKLNDQQAEAVARGQDGNLVITGGPGTGKTTVVFYLLLELLQKETFRNHTIYLTAPSGKAADRLKESLDESCARQRKVGGFGNEVARIESAERLTIHRLLKYNPITNAFSYDAANPFEKDAIFVIDEASMIGVELFAKLLSAIPEGARVYILGDKDQLPSVDAGAAFEEMLNLPQVSKVMLVKSQRFDEKSRVGRLAQALATDDDKAVDAEVVKTGWPDFKTLDEPGRGADAERSQSGDKKNLRLVQYPDFKRTREKREELKRRLSSWIKSFCTPSEKLKALSFTDKEIGLVESGGSLSDVRQEELLGYLKWSKGARILCAERRGAYGVESINGIIDAELGGKKGTYNGQFLMITQNQHLLDLFNGDTGIVVKVGDEPCFMYEKAGRVAFCRLDLIPSEARELAFAMTVHKAQGSGYDDILFFLPEDEKSPLANRQILYTGLTRIQKGVLTLIGSSKVFEACCGNRIRRQTGLCASVGNGV